MEFNATIEKTAKKKKKTADVDCSVVKVNGASSGAKPTRMDSSQDLDFLSGKWASCIV